MQGVFWKDNDKGFFVCNRQYLFMCLKGLKLKPKTPQNKTRAKTAQTMAYSENYMLVKKVAHCQESCIMLRQL